MSDRVLRPRVRNGAAKTSHWISSSHLSFSQEDEVVQNIINTAKYDEMEEQKIEREKNVYKKKKVVFSKQRFTSDDVRSAKSVKHVADTLSLTGILKHTQTPDGLDSNGPFTPLTPSYHSTLLSALALSVPPRRREAAERLSTQDEVIRRSVDFYRRVGEWWNALRKTDYTYSSASPCRGEVVDGVMRKPNMSRNGIHSSPAIQTSIHNYVPTYESRDNHVSPIGTRMSLNKRRLYDQKSDYDDVVDPDHRLSSSTTSTNFVISVWTFLSTFITSIKRTFSSSERYYHNQSFSRYERRSSMFTRVTHSFTYLGREKRWLWLLLLLLLPLMLFFVMGSRSTENVPETEREYSTSKWFYQIFWIERTINSVSEPPSYETGLRQQIERLESLLNREINRNAEFRMKLASVKDEQKAENKQTASVDYLLQMQKLAEENALLKRKIESEFAISQDRLSKENAILKKKIDDENAFWRVKVGNLEEKLRFHSLDHENMRRKWIELEKNIGAEISQSQIHSSVLKADSEALIAELIRRNVTAKLRAQNAKTDPGETLGGMHNFFTSSGNCMGDKCTFGDHTVELDWVRKIIKSELEIYDADKTGMADYALESQGGQVISTRCTESLDTRGATLSVFGISLPFVHLSNGPRTVIQPGMHPGECWAFRGSQGHLVIQLSYLIHVKSFSYEHVSSKLLSPGQMDSAPREFSVYGLRSETDLTPTLIGDYYYFTNGSSLQQFSVQYENLPPFHIVELRVKSNHGNINYTCLYRFRVHGARA